MIFPITFETEFLMMDDDDYREHLLLTSLDDKAPYDSFSITRRLSETSSSLMLEEEEDELDLDLDQSEFLNSDKVGEVTPATILSGATSTPSTPTIKEGEQEENNDDPIEKGLPGKFDVLCGQSRVCANHMGNRRFQVVLDQYAPRYDATTSKQEKMALTKEIVATIFASGGRFLKYKEGLCQEIPSVTARDKVSHALRTKVASWKKHQQQQDTPSPIKGKPTHRRRNCSRPRRSSSSSIATTASDIVTTSFDANDSASSSLMDDLLKTQREIFASLTKSEHSTSSDDKKHPLKK
jgi:hypothetical protein